MAWWDAVKLSVEGALLMFHVGVCFCILNGKRCKDSKFASPFYSLYILQSLFDIVFLLSYEICTGLANFGILVPFLNVGLCLGTYGQLGQGIAHALISLNRFTAIVMPHRSKQIWAPRYLKMACVITFLAPLPVVAIKTQVQYRFAFVEETGAYIAVGTNKQFVVICGFLVLGYCAAIASISFTLELTTFVVYCRLSRLAQLARRDDYKLLVYAMTQMVGQFLAAVCSSLVIIKMLFDTTSYSYIVSYYLFHITVDVLGLSGPVCLLLTSRSVRSSCLRFSLRQPKTVAVRSIV